MSWTTSFPCPTTVRPARPRRQGVFRRADPWCTSSQMLKFASPRADAVGDARSVATRGDGVDRSVLPDRASRLVHRPRQPGASALVRRDAVDRPASRRRPRRQPAAPAPPPVISAPPAFASAPAAVQATIPDFGAPTPHDAHHDSREPVRRARARRRTRRRGSRSWSRSSRCSACPSRRSPGSSWRSWGCGGPRRSSPPGASPSAARERGGRSACPSSARSSARSW